ncbi:hypothetical protein B0J13DRAFT_97832 [Dactylonectria estremocensis]|uniref:Zn(2)-C6 fungal-type domain-containing protein n=1 Tax=Dactylonectria estremocensis TaxID=1079267 RepID=A0A9P9E914_9HYPO|nr:hypothetical protein B0J13DRAFT_97832 [Dactylonectria estremocensis]
MSSQGVRKRVKVLSCSSCRNRKIKCDKVQPVCTQCSRFSFECEYPSRKPTRRAPRPRQTELLNRISRLESIVGKADPARLQQLEEELKGGYGGGDAPAPTERNTNTQGLEIIQDAQHVSKYLSGEFWSQLASQIGGIRQILDQPSDSDDGNDDDDDGDGTSPESVETVSASMSTASSVFLSGNPNYPVRVPLQHPPAEMMARLWAIYARNADPLMKILHRPTIAKILQTYMESPSPQPFDPPTNAVIFAIYFCAATCLTPEDCLAKLGESRDVLSTRYRIQVERALAEADYLNSNALETLQALALYTAMLRCHSHDRSSWVVTALLVRTAQGQGIFRDGDGQRFTPFVAEMRRRLWFFIIVLDVRGSEDRGTDAITASINYTTIRPTAIDDDDFGPESTGPLVSKSTPADNVVLMCTSMCSSIFGLMTHSSPRGTNELSIYSEDDLLGHIRQLEDSFIHTAVPTHLPSVFASQIARIVILKLWLNVQYPFTTSIAPIRRVSRETMLRTSLSLMDLRTRLTEREWGERFGWWADTYVQWHPLAVALAELCVQTEGELVDRAWEVVERNFPASRDNIADSAKGSLWRPIKKLLKKAKAARAEALMKKLDINTSASMPPPTAEFLPMSLLDPTQATSFGDTTSISTQPYDTTAMDPSILFEYPPELLVMDVGPAIGQEGALDWTLWNEFLNDTRLDYSPEGSGAADST